MNMKTMIIIANGLEECEALMTYDLLYRAGIDVELVGLDIQVTSSHNLTFNVHKLINEINPDDYNCLILPGGMPGTVNLENNEAVQNLIDLFVKENKLICAICAAPSILIKKGLLEDEKFVCFPGFENGLKPANTKAIKNNNFITAKGLGAVIDFAYLIIKELINEDKAKEVLSAIQY